MSMNRIGRRAQEHQGPREKALRLSDVKQMFREMKKGIVG
jgi:hypothetical protein